MFVFIIYKNKNLILTMLNKIRLDLKYFYYGLDVIIICIVSNFSKNKFFENISYKKLFSQIVDK